MAALRSPRTLRQLLTGVAIATIALVLGSAPAAPPPRIVPSADAPVIPGHALHGMSDEDMARWVRDYFASHPMRGERSMDVAVDTFIANGNFRFDLDGNDTTAIDTAYIEQGQTLLFKWEAGTHTLKSGDGPNLPGPDGTLFDQPLDATHLEFAFRFDSVGVFPFYCSPHFFFGMQGMVVVRAPAGLRAYQGHCPHQGALLAEGEVEGRALVCRNHRWRFDLESGRRLGGTECLATHPVIETDGQLVVEVRETRAQGAA